MIEIVPMISKDIKNCPILTDDTKQMLKYIDTNWNTSKLVQNISINSVMNSYVLYTDVMTAF